MWDKKNFVKLWRIHELSVSFSCFVFNCPTFLRILQYFLQWCDCMIAYFRKSALKLKVFPSLCTYTNDKFFSLLDIFNILWIKIYLRNSVLSLLYKIKLILYQLKRNFIMFFCVVHSNWRLKRSLMDSNKESNHP